jgi:hypothetical protein
MGREMRERDVRFEKWRGQRRWREGREKKW